MPRTTLELLTFRISHFSEKIRWCLDAAGFDYRERRLTPALHVVQTLGLGLRHTTLPILRTPEGTIQDSTRILRWLERQPRFVPLLPDTGPLREDAFVLEDQLDRTGEAVMACCYAAVLDDLPAWHDWWTPDADVVDRAILRGLLPGLRLLLGRRFGVNSGGLDRARRNIDAMLDLLDARLAGGHGWYLVGDRLSFVDLTACALLGPLFGPEQHPMWGHPAVRAKLAPIAGRWRDRPTAAWVLERYAADRGPWRNALPPARS